MSNNESEVGQSLKQIIEHRLEKIKALKDGGINPFPHNFDLKNRISDLLSVKEPFTKEYQTAGQVLDDLIELDLSQIKIAKILINDKMLNN